MCNISRSYGVESQETSTGREAWAPVFPIGIFLITFSLLSILFSLLSILLSAKFLLRDISVSQLDPWTFLPALIIATIISTIFTAIEGDASRTFMTYDFLPEELSLFYQAKKKISLRMKLAMLLCQPVENLLLEESDPYEMTQMKAKLAGRRGSYYIEIEKVDALKAWDAAAQPLLGDK